MLTQELKGGFSALEMMSNKHTLKAMINERLSEATEDIFALFEQAVAEYQREIERLKKASEDKQPLPCVLSISHPSSEETHQTEEIEENQRYFVCKEETEQLVITGEDVPPILITSVKASDSEDELQAREQQRTQAQNPGQAPEVSGGAESDESFEPDWESEEEESDLDSDEEPNETKKPFSCSVCNKRFAQLRGVKLHVRKAHRDEEPLSSAQSSSHLNFGLRPPNPDTDGPFICSVCKREFKYRFTLEAHMKKHTGGNPFFCLVCTISFPNHYDFICHIKKVHSSDNPYKCSICSRSLKNSRNYRSHMMSHTGERPFTCSVCNRGFLQKGNLKYHMLTHTGEKPFSCSDCGARYTSKQNLMNHKKSNH